VRATRIAAIVASDPRRHRAMRARTRDRVHDHRDAINFF
jgi:hypothetical protein